MTFKHTFPALIFAAAVAAGCGSGEPGGPTFDPAVLNACRLFTPAEAFALAGTGIATMSSTLEDSGDRNPLICAYNTGTTDRPRMLGLELRPARSARAAARRLEGGRGYLERLSGGEIQEVPGLGEKAVWAGGDLHQLQVLQGNLVLVVTAQTDNAPKSLFIAKTISQRALERLGGSQAMGAQPGGTPKKPS